MQGGSNQNYFLLFSRDHGARISSIIGGVKPKRFGTKVQCGKAGLGQTQTACHQRQQ